jgi:hypothetical protein
MQGTDVDNRRRLRQVSERVERDRQVARWAQESSLTFTETGALRPERGQQAQSDETATAEARLKSPIWE